MAAGHEVWDQQSEYRDTSPLLMATPASGHHQHVVNIPPISSLDVPSSPPGGETAGGNYLSSRSAPQPDGILPGSPAFDSPQGA